LAAGGLLFFCTISRKILDQDYIMRNGIKVNSGAAALRRKRHGGTNGPLFLAARLLGGDPNRAL
jgi:hypothetical protein